jgi:hypothetical protein
LLCCALALLALVSLLTRARPAAAAATEAAPEAAAAAPPPKILKLEPSEAIYGSAVTATGEHFPRERAAFTLSLAGIDIGSPLQVAADGKSFIFSVPQSGTLDDKLVALPLGKHPLRIHLKGAQAFPAVPHTAGFLRIVSDNAQLLQLAQVVPSVIDPDTKQIKLLGQGFGLPSDQTLLFDGAEVDLCWLETGCKQGAIKARLKSSHEIVLDSSGQQWRGEHQLSLRAGDASATTPVTVTATPYTARAIRGYAVLFTLAVLALVIGLVVLGGDAYKIGSRRFVLRAFLIDTETDTYSLHKAQAYAWCGTTIFAYSYLALARYLVQGKLDMVDVPENMYGVLALGAGTSVLSMGISKLRGPKASGVVHPRFSDLISTGGTVSPERLNFVCWTAVAIASFLSAVLLQDPRQMEQLPGIPNNLLILSGVSAAGYLGGKAVRGAGPVLDEVVADSSELILTLMGRNLSVDATFEVDGKSITPHLDSLVHPDKRAKVVVAEPGDGQQTQFAKVLKLTLSSLPAAWTDQRERRLTVANVDGQRADCELTFHATPQPAVALEAVAPAPSASAALGLPASV